MAKKKSAEKTDDGTNDTTGATPEAATAVIPTPKEDPAAVRQRMLDQLRDETQQEIRRFNPTLRESEEEYREAKEFAASLKKIMEGNQKRMSMLCDRMTQAMDGTYQFPAPPAPTLPFPENKEADGDKPRLSAPDHGATLPIDALVEHGITEKMAETLESHDVKTVGDLESLMRIDAWWHKKVKGFGGERIDRLSDALTAFRAAHPVPSATESASETSSAAPAGAASDAAEDSAGGDEKEDGDGEE